MKSFFITGTDTDIGKTFVTACLCLICEKLNKKVSVMKPVQTGIEEYSADIATIKSIAKNLEHLDESLQSPFSFKIPASPHLAAEQEDCIINVNKIIESYNKIVNESQLDTLLIEGAGGVYVPITRDYTMLDLMKKLNIPVIIVAGVQLGTINHTLLTINALKNYNIPIAGIIFNKFPKTPSIIEQDNIKIIGELSDVPILAIIKDNNNINIEEISTDKLLQIL